LEAALTQVFISYRHVEPDQGLAESLCVYLEERGLRVFLDKRIQVGLDWVQEIDRQLRASSFLVVLLSEESIRSDMVRQEIVTAHQLRQQGRMTILPIRVGFEGELPYDLGSYLNHIQYALWRSGEPFDRICPQIHAAVAGGRSLPEEPGPENTTLAAPAVHEDAPLPAADPRLVLETGTIRLDSPFYVRRREDAILERCLAQQGSTVIVKGPRQSGKSSLLARAHALSKREGRQSVYLDFQNFDASQLESLGSTLQAMAARIVRSLKATVRPADVWDSELLGDKGSFAAFLEVLLGDPGSPPIVLLLDEVDRLFDQSYRGDFFAAVRGWHNNRATDDLWEGLHLVLGHATDPALWIENLNESPFNVGERLRLGDFTREQVVDLNTRHGNPLRTPGEIDGLVRLIGGHPYLVRQALYVLATEGWALAKLERVAANDDGPFGDHLRRHLWSLGQNQNHYLSAAVFHIVRGEGCEDEGLFHRFLAAGLVVGETRSAARMRCDLYKTYFARHL
jgi:hypothetical protein